MDQIQKNIQHIQSNIQSITKSNKINYPIHLMIATKYATLEQIDSVIKSGITLFGENKIQDAEQKIHSLNNPNIEWHFIGHLQRNKAKKASQLFSSIDSVDSIRLLEKLNEISNSSHPTAIFIQVNIANEDQKFGFSISEVLNQEEKIFSFPNLKIKGIMTMMPYIDRSEDLRPLFRQGKQLFDDLQTRHPTLSYLSMGMSNDYNIAIEEGANLIRLGRAIFK
ncbi:YggS family pyridoxal phosphate-dependent enzyme [Candidatus Marinamargulisbacteria bacterium SCGC AG-410-N11]|nr:YggS family pyridoxal phosphate-dependent enzyme [Candidatus Marinamargulisbacteria bacterium SCGC AG-410-N11]